MSIAKIYKLTDTPASWEANAIYYIMRSGAQFMEIYTTSSAGVPQRLINADDVEAMIPTNASYNIVNGIVSQGWALVVIDNLQFRIPPGNEGRALQIATTDVPNTVTTRSLNYFQNNNSTTVGVRYAINTGFQYFAPQSFTFNTDGDLQEIFIFNESTGKTYRVTALFAHVSVSPNKISITAERIG